MNTRRLFIALVLAVAGTGSAFSQRPTDKLDRGLVVIPTGAAGNSKTNNITWRRLPDEYYDVTYNLYKNNQRIATNLTSTCYGDNSNGLPTTQYQVAAVVRGVEQARCTAVTAWTQYVYKSYSGGRYPAAFLDIPLAAVYDRDGNDVSEHYEPNDAEMADLDGDGQLEIIVKRLNTYDAWNGSELYPINSREFVVLDAYDVNWQTGAATLLWRIDCGPNMISLNSTEIDIIAYDWDEDGQAEVVLRGADNMIVYGPDGLTRLWTVGNMNVNTRDKTGHSDQQYSWTHTGAEYLIYMNGRTGAKYQVMDYPLPRLESGESSEKKAWGDDYGHRSSKYFFGAPFLDGRKASLFLARGIYTRHKMIAMDLNPASHTWSQRWRWNNNSSGSAWFGQGNHNFVVADVDEDGRDEIVYGSMVIDDNGHGLSTTGLGHGDALHVGDLDPYRRGLEVFACNEDKPSCNYRNATTSELYFRQTGTTDDGRALMDNFSNSYPGSMGRSVQTGMISSVTDNVLTELGDFIAWGDLNFRIYWDGDLCSEVLNSPGTAKEAKIDKPGVERIFASEYCNMNNDSKNNPCFHGDIIGDWREEIVLRCGRNLRVYTSGLWTTFSLPTLWADHQYRQAMVWQMMAYNQPPHLSYFLGEMEGITQAPPPLTMDGRTEITSSITTAMNNKHLMLCTVGNANVTVASGAQPYILTVNTPSWVQGHDNNGAIERAAFTHTLTGGALAGSMRLVKQGDGTLVLPSASHTFTGATSVWAGTLRMTGGALTKSAVWLNRFARLDARGTTFAAGITMDYGAELLAGGEGRVGTLTTTTLTMNFGSRLVMDVNDNLESDCIEADNLVLNTVDWNNGPRYLKPVLQMVGPGGGSLPDGTYLIGRIKAVTGSLDDVVIEGAGGRTCRLSYANQQLRLVVGTGTASQCPAATIVASEFRQTAAGRLPVVDIMPTPFTYGNATVTPSVTATFTAANGTTVDADITRRFYDEDYESATDVSGWTSRGAAMSIDSDNEGHGRYFAVNTGTTNTRFAYFTLNAGVDVSSVASYAIEFDLAVTPANTDPVEFCVMSRGGTMPSNTWDNYAAINANANMLFDITAPKSSTTYTLNGTSATTVLPAGTWHHYKLIVNRTTRVVTWSISNGSGGTFNLPAGTSADVAGFYLVAGRYYSAFKLDNIHIYAIDDYTYAFTKPGTLTVSSHYDGCRSSHTTYVATGAQLGDANADGHVSIADLTATTAYIFSLAPEGFDPAAADVDGSGTVDFADVRAIANMIIGK